MPARPSAAPFLLPSTARTNLLFRRSGKRCYAEFEAIKKSGGSAWLVSRWRNVTPFVRARVEQAARRYNALQQERINIRAPDIDEPTHPSEVR
jgi:hypothetical protein